MPPTGFAVRFTMAYDRGVDRIVRAWSLYAKKIVVYQHDDDGANNLHCHAHVEGFTHTVKRFQQLAAESGVPLTIKKEGKTRATSLMSIRGKDYDHHPTGYSYLTKGKYEPSYLMGFTPEETQTWKAAWVPRAQHIKRTVWHQLQDKFEAEVKLDFTQLPPMTPEEELAAMAGKPVYRKHKYLYEKAHAFLVNMSGGQWTPAYMNQLQSIVNTTAWRNNISIPPRWKSNI